MTTVMFVCSGNTCRSPMAECLFNDYARRIGRGDIRAVSAGVSAACGCFASDGAMRAMARRGLSLSSHRSRSLTERDLRDVSLVVGMSEAHIAAVRARYPRVEVPMRYFVPPVADPYGAGDDVYEAAAAELSQRIEWLVDKSAWIDAQKE